MTHWTNPYVGLPWSFAGRSPQGVDCWGLLWLVYRDVLKVHVASYAAETMDAPERAQIAALLSNDRAIDPWRPIARGAERAFDMAVFRRGGIDSHIGVVVEPGRMLHILDGGQSFVDRFDMGRWKPKLVGLHRHLRVMDQGRDMPSILDTYRYAPPYVPTPYTQIKSDDLYVIAEFTQSDGPLDAS